MSSSLLPGSRERNPSREKRTRVQAYTPRTNVHDLHRHTRGLLPPQEAETIMLTFFSNSNTTCQTAGQPLAIYNIKLNTKSRKRQPEMLNQSSSVYSLLLPHFHPDLVAISENGILVMFFVRNRFH